MSRTESLESGASHAAAATAFLDRARSEFESAVVDLHVFGSTARGEASGLASDVDVLVVLADDADRASVTDELRRIAYDVMLNHGPVVELHVFVESRFAELKQQGDPFVRNVLADGGLDG